MSIDWSPLSVRQIPRAAFTRNQRDLWVQKISFVHMSPTDRRARIAMSNFRHICGLMPVGGGFIQNPSQDHWARFMVCEMRGAAAEHCPVMFIDGEEHEFKDQRALLEAKCIPAPITGFPAMVIMPPAGFTIKPIAKPTKVSLCPSFWCGKCKKEHADECELEWPKFPPMYYLDEL